MDGPTMCGRYRLSQAERFAESGADFDPAPRMGLRHSAATILLNQVGKDLREILIRSPASAAEIDADSARSLH